jgi:FkbM family methyltransferase
MRKFIGKSLNRLLRIFNLRIISLEKFEEIFSQSLFYWNDPFLSILKHPNKLVNYVSKSNSQARQDLFVISELDFKENGYFLEIGAMDGLSGSNTYMLEKHFAWNGILVEPSRTYAEVIPKNRRCDFDSNAVWKHSGEKLSFTDLGKTGLSTLSDFVSEGIHGSLRENSTSDVYEVSTISLADLLRKYNAPKIIDYLSIDTEGSELDILASFDFDSYEITLLTVEHNYNNLQRESIFTLLTNAGYERKYVEISHQDDWYVKKQAS